MNRKSNRFMDWRTEELYKHLAENRGTMEDIERMVRATTTVEELAAQLHDYVNIWYPSVSSIYMLTAQSQAMHLIDWHELALRFRNRPDHRAA